MRILLINDGLPPHVLGGTGNIVESIATELAQRGHTITTLSFCEHPTSESVNGNISHFELPARSTRWMHYRSVFSGNRKNDVLNVIDTIKPDIIHAHTVANQAGYRWIAGARKRGIPVIMTAHDVMNVACGRVTGLETVPLWFKDLLRCKWAWNPLRTPIIRRILNAHVTMLAVSDALKEFMTNHGFTGITTMHNGIDTDFWKPEDRNAARAQLKLPQDATIFLLAGRLGIDKGTDLVTRTLPPGAHLMLAGRAHLPDFAAVKDRLHYFQNKGPDDMRTLYAACNAVLVPSKCLDCFPTVCLEAMSCGRIVIATSWGGAKESVVDGHTGWIIDPLDEAQWHERMQWCIDEPAKSNALGKNGRKRIEEGFTLKAFIDSLEDIYAATRQK